MNSVENPSDNKKIVVEEMLRQFNLTYNIFNDQNKKLQFVLGFIFAVFGFSLTQKEFFSTFFSKYLIIRLLFGVGLVSIFFTAIFSFWIFRLIPYAVGPDMKEIFDMYEVGENLNEIKFFIIGNIYKSNLHNQKQIIERGKYINLIIVFIIIGFFLMTFSKIIYLYWG